MKRKREMEKSSSEIKSAIEELSMLNKIKPCDHNLDDANDKFVPTRPFLYICNLLLEILDKVGPTMAVLRQDISQNIKRLEVMCDTDPEMYSNLVEILKKEADEGNAKKITSCSSAFVWLTRSLDFTVALLQRLAKDPERNMEQAVEESYTITLKPWHRWISSAAFKVALKLLPDNNTFISLLVPKDESFDTLNEDIQTLVSLLVPILEENHTIMRLYALDRLKSN